MTSVLDPVANMCSCAPCRWVICHTSRSLSRDVFMRRLPALDPNNRCATREQGTEQVYEARSEI